MIALTIKLELFQPRLKCLAHIIGQLDGVQMDFVSAVVPEAILCTKETGERPRLAAYNLLVEIGNAVMRWSPEEEQGIKLLQCNLWSNWKNSCIAILFIIGIVALFSFAEALNRYFQLLLAGLAGSVHMISATELALTRVLYEFKGMRHAFRFSSILTEQDKSFRIWNNIFTWWLSFCFLSLKVKWMECFWDAWWTTPVFCWNPRRVKSSILHLVFWKLFSPPSQIRVLHNTYKK